MWRRETPQERWDRYEDDAFEAGLDGGGLDQTEIGQLVVRTGLYGRNRAEADELLAPFVEINELAKRRDFGPEHGTMVNELRSRGWTVPFDQFDSEGNTIAGPNYEPPYDADEEDTEGGAE